MSRQADVVKDLLEQGKRLVAFDYWVADGLTSVAPYGVGALSQVITRDLKPIYGDRLVSERVPGKSYHCYYLAYKIEGDQICLL